MYPNKDFRSKSVARKWLVPSPVCDTETSRDKAGYQTVFFFTSTMCFCLFNLSLCFRMQLMYALTIHLWNSILSMLPYFHEYARCFAKSAPCVPARMWTNQIAYNYHVTSCVCRLALSYYVVKFYEWSTWYFGGNQMASYHAPPVIG